MSFNFIFFLVFYVLLLNELILVYNGNWFLYLNLRSIGVLLAIA